MQREELDILCRNEVREAIEQNLMRNPIEVALDKSIPHARVVASQLKNLQKAKEKHPTLYAARCIIPERAIEQSSREECARAKHLRGESLLDMTCGMGGDVVIMAQRFRRVVALERDAVLAEVVRENLRRLQIENVEVVTCSAEEYLEHCEEHFSAILVDPDRRISDRRSVRLEDSSPNVVELMPRMKEVADSIVIKCSPLFDIDQARRLFADCSVEVVSFKGECKEVCIYIGQAEPTLSAVAIGRGSYSESFSRITPLTPPAFFRPESYRYLITPDVALQKARLVSHSLRGQADCWSENSFAFAAEPPQQVVGRSEEIVSIERLSWKSLKRRYSGRGIDIVLRDCPLESSLLHKKMATHSGDEHRLAFTRILGEIYCIEVKRV